MTYPVLGSAGLGHMASFMAADLPPHLRRELAFLRRPGEETA